MQLSRALLAVDPGHPMASRRLYLLRLVRLAGAAAAVGFGVVPAATAADSYPAHPLRLIVPFAPGGAADILARIVGDHLQRQLGQPVVVLNKDGAGTIVGVDFAAKSAPDGYTLLISGDAATINTASGRQLPYDLMKDLKPVSLLYAGTQFVLVNKDSPYKSFNDLVAYGKAHPGDLKFGSTGIGTSTHLSTESINAAAGISAIHVPYRGVAPAMTALMAGEVDYIVAGSTAAIPAIRNGTHRALAITSRARSPSVPGVPTLREQGIPVETGSWYGILVPAATPEAIVQRLHDAIAVVLSSPDVEQKLHSLGGEPRPMSPADATAFMRDEIDAFRALMHKLNLKLTV
jgi:tripartite-type tricarboxylate transporter receptor subunit TctC